MMQIECKVFDVSGMYLFLKVSNVKAEKRIHPLTLHQHQQISY